MISKPTLKIAAECITEVMKPLAEYLNKPPKIEWLSKERVRLVDRDIEGGWEKYQRYKKLDEALREIEAEIEAEIKRA